MRERSDLDFDLNSAGMNSGRTLNISNLLLNKRFFVSRVVCQSSCVSRRGFAIVTIVKMFTVSVRRMIVVYTVQWVCIQILRSKHY